MDYARKWWVRLYVEESNEDRAKPLFARALRDTLLRFAQPLDGKGKPTPRSGELMRGKSAEHAIELLLNAMGAQLDERDQAAAYIEDWIEDGWLTVRKQKQRHILCITNYVAAQTARTKAALRMQRYRARQKKTQQSRSNGGVTGDATRSPTVTSPDAAQFGNGGVRIRERERIRKRGSNIRGPGVTGDVTRYAEDEQLCELAVDYLADPVAVGLEHGEPHTWPGVRRVIEAGNEVWSRKLVPVSSGDRVVQVILDRLSEGLTPAELVEAVYGSKHDDWTRDNPKLQSLANLLKHPDRIETFRQHHANPPTPKVPSQQPAGDYDTGWEDKPSDVVAPAETKAAAR
jgi:hypothetical protein